jgi:AcrR family transcriptional regulator
MSQKHDDRDTGQVATRDALIAEGMRLFGSQGFDGTSIREIAAAANTNSASIAYHFGSKEGLRRACAETIAARMNSTLGPVLLSAGAAPDAETAGRILEQTATAMAYFMLTRPEAENIAPFLLREVSNPGEVMDIIYGKILLNVHTRVCKLWAAATGGDPDSEETLIEVFAMVGQVLYFRIGREIVLRRMGWKAVSQAEAAKIAAVITSNIRAMIAAKRGDRS